MAGYGQLPVGWPRGGVVKLRLINATYLPTRIFEASQRHDDHNYDANHDHDPDYHRDPHQTG